MDECIDSRGEATFFSAPDARSGYWQVEMEDENRDKTAITLHDDLYRFVRMPIGLMNAPGTIQRTMEGILASIKWQFALVYLDDIFIFSKVPEKHVNHFKHMLTLPQRAGVTSKLEKCSFFTDTINYLGHVIRPRRLMIDADTADAIKKLKEPRIITELCSFLGLCNVFQRFFPSFARKVAPLNHKLHKYQPKKFVPLNKEELTAIRLFKHNLFLLLY